MIVNKECLHKLAELTIDRLIADGIQSAWSGDYQINLLSENIDILMDVKLFELGTAGVGLSIRMGMDSLADLEIEDCRMFGRAAFSEDLARWRKETHETLVNNYARWMSYKYVTKDSGFLEWINKAKEGKVSSLCVNDLVFKTYMAKNTAWFQVESGNVTMYRVERTNYLGMTTKQGWQGMGPSTIKGEALRVILILLLEREGFNLPVSL